MISWLSLVTSCTNANYVRFCFMTYHLRRKLLQSQLRGCNPFELNNYLKIRNSVTTIVKKESSGLTCILKAKATKMILVHVTRLFGHGNLCHVPSTICFKLNVKFINYFVIVIVRCLLVLLLVPFSLFLLTPYGNTLEILLSQVILRSFPSSMNNSYSLLKSHKNYHMFI
jgi:hypothetical protein